MTTKINDLDFILRQLTNLQIAVQVMRDNAQRDLKREAEAEETP